MIDRERILRVAPAAAPYINQLLVQMQRRHISDSEMRAAIFLGQIHIESQGFEKVVESLNFSEQRLLLLFNRNRISAKHASMYGRNDKHPADQQMLADILYGGAWGKKNLGNTQLGDGWRFRGRGLKQLTGRDNYTRFSKWWFGDDRVVQDPEMVAQPHGAVASAVWFWADKELNQIADRGDIAAVTKVVNGGSILLAERIAATHKYMSAFQS